MLLPARQNKNKRGLSLVIGYVLLIAISIVMSIIVYQWLKTYVPTESIKCSEGTSIFISDISYDCTNKILEITVKNNGKFSVGGYFIYASNKQGEELATIDLSSNITGGGSAYGFTNSINFLSIEEMTGETEEKNSLIPNDFITSSFENIQDYGQLYKIEIIPTRIQKIDNKERLVSCSDAKIEEIIECNEEV